MSSELEILEKIELYSRGRLSQAEASALEAQMELDPQLKKRVLASSIVDEIIVSHEAMKLKQLMQKDMATPSSKWKMYLSTVVLVAATGGFAYFMLSKENEKEKVVVNTATPLVQQEAASGKEETVLPPFKQDQTTPTHKTITEKGTPETKSTSITEFEKTISVSEKIESPLLQTPSILPYEKEIVERQTVKTNEVVSAPCDKSTVEIDFYTVPSCAGGETGELHIRSETLKKGVSPFTYLLDGRNATSTFDRLSSGVYRLMAKDARGCTFESSKEVVVSSKSCKEKKEYAYNPEFDLSWVIPFDAQKEPKSFRIMDKGGKLFFQTTVTGSHPAEWKGESNQGLSLGSGLHFFYIEYTDGSVDEGSIIVTR